MSLKDNMKTLPRVSISPSQREILYSIKERWPNGCNIELESATYVLSKELELPSNVSIVGKGADRTILVLAPRSHCHLFTNESHKDGNAGITLSGFTVVGNGDTQQRQSHHKALTFGCAMYFKKCHTVVVSEVVFEDVRQTCVHFNACEGLLVEKCRMTKMGWSGVSTSDASNLKILDVVVSDAGRDAMHSAIHLDGGVGVYCHADVSDTTGNGIMLDSTYGPLRHVVVKGSATGCKRGVSLSGSAVNELSDVLIAGRFFGNREVGIMVSNARSVVLNDCEIERNREIGVLLQGRAGGCDVMIVDCRFDENGEDISEIHASKGNWVFTNVGAIDRNIKSNKKTILEYKISRRRNM